MGNKEKAMNTISKFPVPITGEFELKIPRGSITLSVQEQGLGKLVMWIALGDPDNETVTRVFKIYGTGHLMAEKLPYLRHIETVQMKNELVWHIFEKTKELVPAWFPRGI